MAGISDAFDKLINIVRIGHAMSFVQRSPAQHGLFMLTAGLCCTGVILSVIALLRFYETTYRSDMAALLTALVVFIAALLSYVVLASLRNNSALANSKSGIRLEQDIKDLIEIILGELAEPVKDNPKMAVLIAAIVGFFVARSK